MFIRVYDLSVKTSAKLQRYEDEGAVECNNIHMNRHNVGISSALDHGIGENLVERLMAKAGPLYVARSGPAQPARSGRASAWSTGSTWIQ